MSAPRIAESAVRFGAGARLVGILSEAVPTAGAPTERRPARPAVLLLNSGLIHRVAPNRLYVRLARELAAVGHDGLRFDFAGIGDSAVRTDALPVEESGVAETIEAMSWLAEARGHTRFLLIGLCGGGYFSFRTATRDPRVAGLVLLNVRGHLEQGDPERSDALGRAAMRIHYRRIATSRSYRRKNVLKLLRGQFDARGALASLRRSSASEDGGELASLGSGEAYAALCERGVRILNLYSEGDWSIDYLTAALGPEAPSWLERPGSRFERIDGANHVFTPRWSQDRVVSRILEWARATPWNDPDG